jgi:hypothetical protein
MGEGGKRWVSICRHAGIYDCGPPLPSLPPSSPKHLHRTAWQARSRPPAAACPRSPP